MAIDEDRFDALDDDALVQLLANEADRRREHLVIEEHAGGWVAETYESGGLSSGRSVMLGGAGADRRAAIVALARKFEADGW